LAIFLLIANANEKSDDCRFENKTGKEKQKKMEEELFNLSLGKKIQRWNKTFSNR